MRLIWFLSEALIWKRTLNFLIPPITLKPVHITNHKYIYTNCHLLYMCHLWYLNMKNRFDRMLLKSNNTLGEIQAGFMKLIPIYTPKRVKTAQIKDGPTKEKQVIGGTTNQRDSIELEVVLANKNRSKRKSRNNSVRVVNRSQAKTMSSLQALRGALAPSSNGSLSPSLSNGTRHYSVASDHSGPPSPCLEHEILPYTLTVDVSEFQQRLYTHAPRHHSLMDTRKVRFNWLLISSVSEWVAAIYVAGWVWNSHGCIRNLTDMQIYDHYDCFDLWLNYLLDKLKFIY